METFNGVAARKRGKSVCALCMSNSERCLARSACTLKTALTVIGLLIQPTSVPMPDA